MSSPFELDRRALRVFRMALASVFLADLAIRAMSIAAHYSDEGLLSRSALLELYPSAARFSLNLVSGAPQWQWFLMVCGLFSGIGVLTNFAPRILTPICWLLLISFQNRNPLVFHLGDSLSHQLWFWAMFLPWENRARGTVKSVATAGLVVQIGLVYFFSVFEKTGAPWTTEKSAVYLALQIDQFVTPIAIWMRTLPIQVLMWATDWVLWVEIVAPLLLVTPWPWVRFFGVLQLALLHIGFAVTLHLGTFPWVDLAALVAVVPSCVWNRLETFRIWNRVLNFGFKNPLDRELSVGTIASRWFSRLQSGMLAILIVYVVLWNILNIGEWRRHTIGLEGAFAPFRSIGETLSLGQRWDMFSPFPLVADGYFEFEGLGDDGMKHDLWIRPGAARYWKRGSFATEFYPDERWRRVVGGLYFDHHAGARRHVAQYLCRRWNESQPPLASVGKVAVIFNEERTRWPPEESSIERRVLWEGGCS